MKLFFNISKQTHDQLLIEPLGFRCIHNRFHRYELIGLTRFYRLTENNAVLIKSSLYVIWICCVFGLLTVLIVVMFCIQSVKGSPRGKKVLNLIPVYFKISWCQTPACVQLTGLWIFWILFVTMATLITLKLRKKNILFTKVIASLIWVFLKFLVQRTETLLVLFRLRREFFYGYSGFPLLSEKQQSTFQFGLSHP